MIKAILFDLDGTLVNSLEDLAAASNYALRRFGYPEHKTDEYRYFVGDGIPKLIERVLPENARTNEIQSDMLKIFMNYYREHFADSTAAYEGIMELITYLRLKGYCLAVISNKAQEMAAAVTAKVFGGCFDIVCGKTEGYKTKPDPQLTLKVIGDLGVQPGECIFVGDSGMDMRAAKSAGCIAVGVLWGFREEKELTKNGADYTVCHPNDIIGILEDL